MAQSTDRGSLETMFIFAAVSAWLVQTGVMVFLVVEQYASNSNLSSFYGWMASSALSPVVIAALLYSSRRKKSLSRRGIFELLVATTGVLLFSMVVSSLQTWVSPFAFSFLEADDATFTYLLIPIVSSLLLTAATAWYLRRSKDW